MKLPLWTLAPFVLVVFCVAVVPAVAPGFWRRYRFMLLATLAMPILSLSFAFNPRWVTQGFVDYVSFICLLGALFALGGGLLVHGAPKANPVSNLGFMALGALLANLIGTLGTSMLLIRPLLRSNRGRRHQNHVLVFFIFIVANAAGMLTPLGDPPLLMGFLMGVPFWWTLKLFAIWFFVITSLFGIFTALDSYFYLNDPDFRGPLVAEIKEPFRITGRWNFALIPLVIIALILPRTIPVEYELWRVVLRISILLLVIYLSHRLTPKVVVMGNNFTWDPFYEVAIVFAGIFATMIPAVKYMQAHAASFGLSTPWNFYWASGFLSGVLDNAPTYASFFAIAQGLGQDASMVTLSADKLISEPLLIALSCGSVLFGAMTYIGNAPNLLVKAVAEEEGVKMPSFFGYMLWSLVFFLPVLFVTGMLFF